MKSDRSVAPRRARPVLGQPTYVAPRYHSSVWGRLIFALLIVALCGGVGVFGGGYWALHRAQGSSARIVPVHVSQGDTVTSIADRLQRAGVINSATLFRVDARLHSLAAKLRAGDYQLRRNMSIEDMVAALQVLHTQYVKILVPEGLRIEQIAASLQRQGVSGQGFLREALHPDLTTARYPVLKDKPANQGLQGYLFPNTYYVPLHFSGKQMAAKMVRTLDTSFTPQMRAQAARQRRSIHQILTMASIIEREAQAPAERATIASVYWNRLKANIGLYADPTVQFVVGKPGNWWPVLTTIQLHTPSRYNTYINPGLPPGPIANPGLASIEAALNPANTNFLYFVAKGHGLHAFETSLADHNADVCKFEHTGC